MLIPTYLKKPIYYYQYYTIRFWDGSRNVDVLSNAGNGFYDFLRTLPSVAAAIKQLEDAGLSFQQNNVTMLDFLNKDIYY